MYIFYIKTHDFQQIVNNSETNNALPTTRILKWKVSFFIIQLAKLAIIYLKKRRFNEAIHGRNCLKRRSKKQK